MQILEKGDLQVSDKERQTTSDSSFKVNNLSIFQYKYKLMLLKEVANLIANMCVNPETQRPYSLDVD
jgi:ribosome maturation protein Sdo1